MSYRPQLRGEPSSPVFPLRVFILSEDTLAADGLRAALREDPRLTCVGEPTEAEVVVWDWGPASTATAPHGGAARDWQERLARSGLNTGLHSLLVLVPDDASAAGALALGAQGVLLRRAHAPTLAAAVIAVRLGLCVMDGPLAEQFVGAPQDQDPPLTAADAPARDSDDGERMRISETLTHREREVLETLALGLSNRAIAERLGVSVHTVKFHVNGILGKLDVDSRAGAVAKALRGGLVRT